jgi:hypothetical protein
MFNLLLLLLVVHVLSIRMPSANFDSQSRVCSDVLMTDTHPPTHIITRTSTLVCCIGVVISDRLQAVYEVTELLSDLTTAIDVPHNEEQTS